MAGRVVRSAKIFSMPASRHRLRIVSLAPSATSILCAIGARKYLVGVSRWCADVAPVKGLPRFGDCWRLDSVKGILKLRPTLVIGSVPFRAEAIVKLLEQPLNFLAENPRTLADIENNIRLFGGITRRQRQAERLVTKMRAAFSAIEKQSRAVNRKLRVYCEAWPNPRISSPPWVAELVRICGGKFVVPAGQKVTDAQVAGARPDVIVVAWAATGDRANAEKLYRVAAWKDVPAILRKNVFVVRDELLNTPGPPLMEGAKRLFEILQRVATREGRG